MRKGVHTVNRQLTVFTAVADCGSFTKAAEKLYTTPTGVMKQINALEERLGLTLLERSNQGVRMTLAGETIYRDAKFLFEYSAKAIENARQLMEVSETTICVGTSILNPCKEFMDLWYQINGDFPGYRLHIVPFEDNHESILRELSALGEKFDFILGVCDSALWLSRCSFYELGRRRFCCTLPRGHRLAEKESLSIEDLYGEGLMMVRRGDSRTNDKIRDEIENSHPRITILDTDFFYDIDVFNECERSNSILLTLDVWAEVHPALITIPINWDYSIPYGLLYALDPPEDILRVVEAIKKIRP